MAPTPTTPEATSPDDGTSTPDDNVTLIDGDEGTEGATDEDSQPHDEDAQGSTVNDSQIPQQYETAKPQSAVGAFVNDDGIDLNESADHGPNVQGNKYGVSEDALENFIADAEAEIEQAERRIQALRDQIENHRSEQNKDED